jgi:predicted membrane-bound mannosyltransferase
VPIQEEVATRKEADTKVTEEAVEALKEVTNSNRTAQLQLSPRAPLNASNVVKMVTSREIALRSKRMLAVLLPSNSNSRNKTTTKVVTEEAVVDTRATTPVVVMRTTVEAEVANKTTMAPKVESTKRLTTRKRHNLLRKLLK